MCKSIKLKSVLLITPPFTQLNTPYPATAYIKGFLNTKSLTSYQVDLGIEVILKLFSKSGLSDVFEIAENFTLSNTASNNSKRIIALKSHYLKTIDVVISFLQGKNPTLARQICTLNFLPEASRFLSLDDMEWAFGSMGMQDKAKHLATLYLEDLSDLIVECVDAHFGFSRYAEKLGRSANSFDELYEVLNQKTSLVDDFSIEILTQTIKFSNPILVCFSVPFPGNLYSAFRLAQTIKKQFPHIKIAMGGGFPNTELRSLTEKRVFEFFDYISLDDGERPLELIIRHLNNPSVLEFKRTYILLDEQVQFLNNSFLPDYKQSEVGTPDYSDLKLGDYISVIEIANPMHSLWSDGRWNKLTMAHGCYWGKCTFCDISLDYIKIYEPIAANIIVDRMEEMMEQTGESGFHFVDEAAPPALMRAVAIEILKRKLVVTWWTNIRFEKSFTKDLCYLLQASGCIAVSGGLEVASDRLLALIQKGVTVAQVAKVAQNFTEAGVMVHAYLMYGYPTQTIQETVDSLEMVRQLFENGILQSGFWHQFAMTAHSPVGLNPEVFGVIPQVKEISFANNDVDFVDNTGIDHSKFSMGLKKSLFNYMHGIGFDFSLQDWFDFKLPKTSIASNFILNCLNDLDLNTPKSSSKIIWLGTMPEVQIIEKSKKGMHWIQHKLIFHLKNDTVQLVLSVNDSLWLQNQIPKMQLNQSKHCTFGELKESYEEELENFELLWTQKSFQKLRYHLLLVF